MKLNWGYLAASIANSRDPCLDLLQFLSKKIEW